MDASVAPKAFPPGYRTGQGITWPPLGSWLERIGAFTTQAGDKATETNQALSIVRECIIEINQALAGGIAQPITEPNSRTAEQPTAHCPLPTA